MSDEREQVEPTNPVPREDLYTVTVDGAAAAEFGFFGPKRGPVFPSWPEDAFFPEDCR